MNPGKKGRICAVEGKREEERRRALLAGRCEIKVSRRIWTLVLGSGRQHVWASGLLGPGDAVDVAQVGARASRSLGLDEPRGIVQWAFSDMDSIK